ncbi:hypothetical protein BpHYR1_011104, partial [Brachionus plicatilis]
MKDLDYLDSSDKICIDQNSEPEIFDEEMLEQDVSNQEIIILPNCDEGNFDSNFDNIFYYKIEEILIMRSDVKSLLENEWLTATILEAYAKIVSKKSKKKIALISSFYSTEISYNGKTKSSYKIQKYIKIFDLSEITSLNDLRKSYEQLLSSFNEKDKELKLVYSTRYDLEDKLRQSVEKTDNYHQKIIELEKIIAQSSSKANDEITSLNDLR